MDEQELIQINLRLPPSALDSLSNLAEQLRKLTAVVNGAQVPSQVSKPAGALKEVVESGYFDPERFWTLRRGAEKSASASSGEAPEAPAVKAGVLKQVQEPESTGQTVNAKVLKQVQEPESAGQAVNAKVLKQVQEPESAGQTELSGEPVREEVLPPEEAERLEPPRQAVKQVVTEGSEKIPAVRSEIEDQVPDAPSVRMDPESQIPEAEEVWAQSGEREFPLPTAQPEPLTGVETPLGAGIVVTAQPEVAASRWTGVTEELVTSGPAPLTAEAVSLAFQRDGRRYDNGFPLY